MTPEEYAKLTPGEREAAVRAWFDEQERRDAAGQLRAIQAGNRDRGRLERGEVSREELDQEENDDLARIGLVGDAEWDGMSRDEQREALRAAYGKYPVTTGSIYE